jgi:hypothetical protein
MTLGCGVLAVRSQWPCRAAFHDRLTHPAGLVIGWCDWFGQQATRSLFVLMPQGDRCLGDRSLLEWLQGGQQWLDGAGLDDVG